MHPNVQNELSEARLMAFNDALVQKGMDFIVEIRVVDYDWFGSTAAYLGEIYSLIESGQQVDIIYTGITGRTVDHSTSFAGIISDPMEDSLMWAHEMGLIAPLDDYLFAGDGRLLYESFPAKAWETVKINHQIYSIPEERGFGNIKTLSFYGFRPQEYNIDEKSLSGDPLSWEPLLTKINDPNALRFSIRASDYAHLMGYDSVVEPILFDPNRGAFNFFEDEECLRLLYDIRMLVEKGYAPAQWEYVDIDENPIQKRISYYQEMSLYLNWDKEYYNIPIYPSRMSPNTQGTAIASVSQNKDRCVKLLSLLYTDKDMADLFVYGVEGIDYTLEKGLVSHTSYLRGITGLSEFTTRTVCDYVYTPYLDEWKNALYENLEDWPTIGFRFHRKGWEHIIDDLLRIVQSFETHTVDDLGNLLTQKYLLCGQFDNMEETLEQLRQELRETGIDELITEINRQYNEWKSGVES
jgi:putative aldouronate transport system substrate-binding protein